MKNLLVAQSGGPAATLNAIVVGCAQAVKQGGRFNKVYGAQNGIEGVLTDRLTDLTPLDDEQLDGLSKTPAAHLGSCRFELPDFDVDDTFYVKIFSTFAKHNVKAFIYIGGQNSMRTVKSLCKYAAKIGSDVHIIGVPKTIDNDITGTDFCVGFGSAAKFVSAITREIYADSKSYSAPSVTILEIMGRHTGWLCAASSLAKNTHNAAPHFIYMSDVRFDANDYITDLESSNERNIVVAVSEGLRYKNGRLLSEDIDNRYIFGGCGRVLEGLTRESLGCKTRVVELNVLQRCAGHYMSKTDYDCALLVGKEAVHLALNHTAAMAGFTRHKNSWIVQAVDIDTSTSGIRYLPQNFINEFNNFTTAAYEEYCRPLIMGEIDIEHNNGLPRYY